MEEKIFKLYDKWKEGKERTKDHWGVYQLWFLFLTTLSYIFFIISAILSFFSHDYRLFIFIFATFSFYYLLKIGLPLLPFKSFKSKRSESLQFHILLVYIPLFFLSITKLNQGSSVIGSLLLAVLILLIMNSTTLTFIRSDSINEKKSLISTLTSYCITIRKITIRSIFVAIITFLVSFLVVTYL